MNNKIQLEKLREVIRDLLKREVKLQKDLEKANKTIELLGAMAGNPSAKEGCRLICVKVRACLEELRGKE